MKTIRYTAAMLIAMTLATGAYAQPARRTTNEEKKERVPATQSTRVRTQPQEKPRTVQPDRKEPQRTKVDRERNVTTERKVQERPEVNRERNVTTERKVQERPEVNRERNVSTDRPPVQRERVVDPQRDREQPDVQRNHNDRPVSISNRENPNSDYRRADDRVYVEPARRVNTKVNKYSTERYYGGHYYPYVYPTTRVEIYHHHDTYRNNYRVLYHPAHMDIFWTRDMYRDYAGWYPDYRWRYRYGYRIETIPIWDARHNLGEVANVYGRVYATWHNRETDDFLLFFGGDFPYQEFTVVLPGSVARNFSWRPERYFLGEHIMVTGLITTFDGIPEIVVKHRRQIDLY